MAYFQEYRKFLNNTQTFARKIAFVLEKCHFNLFSSVSVSVIELLLLDVGERGGRAN